MAPTPQTPQRRIVRLLTLLVSVVVVASACSATPSWIPVDGTDGVAAASVANSTDSSDAPAELAFVDADAADGDIDSDVAEPAEPAQPEPVMPSPALCSASANIWVHSAALNLLGDAANDEMTRIAMANVAEWIERSTLFDEPVGPDHSDMLGAFGELQELVGSEFDFEWAAFQASTLYANHSAALTYESARSELVPFLNDQCVEQRMSDLRSDAEARAAELAATFAAEPSTVAESDSLPGHSIFTHSSGRLIASFPSAWAYEERSGNAIVEFAASPDITRFLDGDAIDGVHLQLVEAMTEADFRALLDETRTATSCERTNDLADTGAVRMNITQTYACTDHGATIIGQFSERRGLGLIIEASFDRVDASRADLIRLASIANSALWS